MCSKPGVAERYTLPFFGGDLLCRSPFSSFSASFAWVSGVWDFLPRFACVDALSLLLERDALRVLLGSRESDLDRRLLLRRDGPPIVRLSRPALCLESAL